VILGQVLDHLGDEAFANETLVAMDDLPLMVAVQSAGERYGESAAAYAVGAVRRFATFAGDEDWLALMTALERADDPGASCLRQMLGWALGHDCNCERN
jgi:hypothetical protein